MFSYIVRRILLMVPTLLGITAVVFFIMAAAPGDVTEMLLSREGEMRPGEREARRQYIEQRYGLDKPVVIQYFNWLHRISPIGTFVENESAAGVGFIVSQDGDDPNVSVRFGLKKPDLGKSFVIERPVLDLIAEALPITLLLNVISIPVIYAIAIVTGLYAARHRGKLFDVTSGSVMMGLWSIPTIWAGVLLIGFFANEQYFKWFPTAGLHSLRADDMPFLPQSGPTGFQPGWLLDTLWHLALPVICLSYGGFAFLSKLTRGAVLENLRADFVRTARAKGVAERDVLWRHVIRNSLLPLITVAAHILPGLLAGSIIVETIFSIPGMGKLMIQSIEFKDQEVVMAATLAGGMLTIIAYLIADVLYAVADPRVSYE